MRIGGLQKLTVQDFPGKVACILFTAGCNFRCPFCHNGDLVRPDWQPAPLPWEEVKSFLQKRRGLLDGVCISGGEPMIQADLEEKIMRIKEMGYAVKLDTNGSFPEKLRHLAGAGLIDYVAMDIKNSPEKYARTAGLADMDLAPIRESVDFLLQGSLPYEFRTTLVWEFHTAADVLAIARWIQGAEKYFLQNYTHADTVLERGLHGFTPAELQDLSRKVAEILPSVGIR